MPQLLLGVTTRNWVCAIAAVNSDVILKNPDAAT
jgi:hypothetical protein